jgi:hypothetical protein
MQITVEKSELDAELDRILGDRLLFALTEPQHYGGPSVPTLHRWRRAGLIDFVKSGRRSKLSRPTMKGLLGKGVPLEAIIGGMTGPMKLG